MDTITINVKGMTCGGCVASVTRVLNAVDGVASAQVSLESSAAQVRYDPARTNAIALKTAIEEAGYQAE